MTQRPPTSSPPDGDWQNYLLIGMAILFGLSLLLWGTGVVATLLAHGTVPRGGGVATGVGVLVRPGDPAGAWPEGAGVPGAAVYWAVFTVLAIMLVGVTTVVWRTVNRSRTSPAALRRKVHATPGVAGRAEVARYAGPKALAAKAATVRPSLAGAGKVTLRDAGYRLGASHGVDVWASVEDSMLIVGPPRSGKGLHLVINAILDAPGAVVTTSTRADSLAVTYRARQQVGEVSVFDPQNLAGLPSGLRWSPIRGCEVPRTAMVRAGALAASTGLGKGGVSDGNFWQDQTKSALQSLLHAAALADVGIDRLFRWSLDPVAAEDAIEILRGDDRAAVGWEDGIDAAVHADPRTRDSIWLGVRQSLAPLADPTVRAAVDPGSGEAFDAEEFLTNRGTLFLLGTGAGVGAAAGLLAALVEDITETARRLAARSAGARLDPPLALVLDEIANLSPLPSLPTLMADGGGTGITPIVVLQSLSQARSRWDADAAGAIWDAAIVKVILGGGSNARDLKELSDLIGQRDDNTVSHSHGADGRRSSSTSQRRIEILAPDAIRSLPFGVGLVLLRSTAPIVTDLTRWTDRGDATQLRAAQHEVEGMASAAAR